MNWEKYKFVTIHWGDKKRYQHYIIIDNVIFTLSHYGNDYLKFFKKDSEWTSEWTYNRINIFPLRERHINYLHSQKYWYWIYIPFMSYKDDTEFEYILKYIKREELLEKIINDF